jgi:hypothetical protein
MKTPRRFVEKADLQPNQGWLSLHESGSYGYNLQPETRLNDVQNQLNDVEDRLRAIVNVPLHVLRLTTQQIQELVLAHLPAPMRQQVLAAIRGELVGCRTPRLDQ